MEELFLSKEHIANFTHMMIDELEFDNFNDPYWRSLAFIVAGDEQLFSQRHALINFDRKEIKSDRWFSGIYSSGEQRLLGLAYNLFTNLNYYEFEDSKKYYISPLEIFSGIDQHNYKLAKNAIDVRLQY